MMTFVDELKEEGKISEKISVAVNCLKKGLQVALITEITGLSTEQINALAQEHKIS